MSKQDELRGKIEKEIAETHINSSSDSYLADRLLALIRQEKLAVLEEVEKMVTTRCHDMEKDSGKLICQCSIKPIITAMKGKC